MLRKSEARERKEAGTRARLKAGELGLDIYGMREELARKGLVYRPYGTRRAERCRRAASATATEAPVLRAAIGTYKHTAALKSGQVASDQLRLDFADVSPVNRAFAPMVRELRFDVCEMAIATFLQAKAYGKQLVLLPVTVAARFQEGALLCRADSDDRRPRRPHRPPRRRARL